MYDAVLLDSGPLGQLVSEPEALRGPVTDWLESLAVRGGRVVLPDSSDYELRRELVRVAKGGRGSGTPHWAEESLVRLDRLRGRLILLPISTAAMRRAAELWADARRRGRAATANDRIDFDVILAAMAQILRDEGLTVVVATDNVKHLRDFIDARPWQDIAAA